MVTIYFSVLPITSDCEELLPEAPGAFDDEMSVKLWDLSMKLVKLAAMDMHEKLR